VIALVVFLAGCFFGVLVALGTLALCQVRGTDRVRA
jgi:hypothetical protein